MIRSTILGVLLTALLSSSAPLSARALQYRPDRGDGGDHMVFTLSSPRFSDGKQIPPGYTCDGSDSSPGIYWSEPPQGTKSLALIVEDPDAPSKVFTHWVLYDIPPIVRGLDDDLPKQDRIPNGAAQGTNDFGRTGYGGPCPPSGSHRYVFTLYALDLSPELPPGLTKEGLRAAIAGHVLGQARLTGVYARR